MDLVVMYGSIMEGGPQPTPHHLLILLSSDIVNEGNAGNMTADSIEINQKHLELIESVIRLATQYEELMDHKQKLGITGEIGEIRACLKYNLRLMLDSRSAGYDALDKDGKKVQIKTRRSELGKKLTNPTRISSFSRHEFDYCLLLLLDKDYDIDEVWKADALALEPKINYHKRRNPTLGGFKSVGEKIFDKKISP